MNQEKIKKERFEMEKKEFENYLKGNNVTTEFLQMSREELKDMFGEEFLKTVDYWKSK